MGGRDALVGVGGDLHILSGQVGAEEEDELHNVDDDEDEEQGEVLAALEEVRRHQSRVVQRIAQAPLVQAQGVRENVHQPHRAPDAHRRGGVAR